MPDHPSEMRELDDAIAALERLRGKLPDSTVDAAIASLRVQGGAIAQGQDALAVGAGGVGIGGDSYGDINTGIIIQQAAKPGAGKEELRRAYLARILNQANQLPLFAGDSANAQIRLSSVYTALLTQHGELDAMKGRGVRDDELKPEQGGARQSVLDRLNAERKLVLLGGPGSGKSTFVNFVALCMAGEMLGAAAVNLKTLAAPIPPTRTTTTKSHYHRSGIVARCCRCQWCCVTSPVSFQKVDRSTPIRCGGTSKDACSGPRWVISLPICVKNCSNAAG